MPMQGSGWGGIFTDDKEVMVSETERESDVFSQYIGSFSANTYVILASINNPAFPHRIQGQTGTRIDVTSLYWGADLLQNADCVVHIGVITRIDSVNADIQYPVNLPFLTVQRITIADSMKGFPSQVKLDFDETGRLLHGITNYKETNVIAVNTGLLLDSPAGTISPGLGDVIMKYSHTAGGSIFGAFIFYHCTD